MEHFIGELAGFLVWLVANGMYVDLRRRGDGGFARIVAFFLGLPLTWVSWLVVPEASQPRIEPPPDDDAGLLEEIRRDRALRLGPEPEQDGARTVEQGEEDT